MTEVQDGVVQRIESNDTDTPVAKDGNTYTEEELAVLAQKSGDTVEHMKEMLGLYNKDEKDTGNSVDDKLLAGKFKSEEDLSKGIQSLIDKYGAEKAYKMLEGNLGKQTDVDTGNSDNTDTKDALNEETDASDKDTGKKSVDMDKYFNEFGEKGSLSEDSYKELESSGLSRQLVDQYIKGLEAQATLFTNQVYNHAGGQEQFDAMVEWGSNNLSDAEKTRFNNTMQSGNLDNAALVLDALKSRYEASEGSFKRGGVKPSNANDGSNTMGYQSIEEYKRDIADPRYQAGDTAFHELVKQKIRYSKVI